MTSPSGPERTWDLRVILEETKVKDIMTKDVVSVRVDASFSEVPKKMKEYSIRHLPVVDSKNKLVGMITQRMLYRIQVPRKLLDGELYYDESALRDIILKHVMVPNPYTMKPEDNMGKLLLKMVYGRYGSVPIVDDDNTLCGLVTRHSVLKVVADIYAQRDRS